MNIISLDQGRAMAERLLEEALFRLDISNFVNSNAPCEIIGLTMRCWWLKKFKHTNEELELAKIQTEKDKKKKELEE